MRVVEVKGCWAKVDGLGFSLMTVRVLGPELRHPLNKLCTTSRKSTHYHQVPNSKLSPTNPKPKSLHPKNLKLQATNPESPIPHNKGI